MRYVIKSNNAFVSYKIYIINFSDVLLIMNSFGAVSGAQYNALRTGTVATIAMSSAIDYENDNTRLIKNKSLNKIKPDITLLEYCRMFSVRDLLGSLDTKNNYYYFNNNYFNIYDKYQKWQTYTSLYNYGIRIVIYYGFIKD